MQVCMPRSFRHGLSLNMGSWGAWAGQIMATLTTSTNNKSSSINHTTTHHHYHHFQFVKAPPGPLAVPLGTNLQVPLSCKLTSSMSVTHFTGTDSNALRVAPWGAGEVPTGQAGSCMGWCMSRRFACDGGSREGVTNTQPWALMLSPTNGASRAVASTCSHQGSQSMVSSMHVGQESRQNSSSHGLDHVQYQRSTHAKSCHACLPVNQSGTCSNCLIEVGHASATALGPLVPSSASVVLGCCCRPLLAGGPVPRLLPKASESPVPGSTGASELAGPSP